MKLRLKYKNHEVDFTDVDDSVSVTEIKNRVSQEFGLHPTLIKLFYKGRLLNTSDAPIRNFHIVDNSRVFVVASSPDAVEEVKNIRSDPTMRPLVRPVHKLVPATSNNLRREPEMRFTSIVTLPGFADEQAARDVLVRIASDGGVVAVMKKHNWAVPVLREMYPKEKVGIDPVCVLGLNTNKGQEIQLRIRTDDLRGFRKYSMIREVMFHELAHNRFSEHNEDFFNFMSQLQREAEALDWTQQPGRTLTAPGGVHLPETMEDYVDDPYVSAESHGGILGGSRQAVRDHAVSDLAGGAALRRMSAKPQKVRKTEGDPILNSGRASVESCKSNITIDDIDKSSCRVPEAMPNTNASMDDINHPNCSVPEAPPAVAGESSRGTTNVDPITSDRSKDLSSPPLPSIHNEISGEDCTEKVEGSRYESGNVSTIDLTVDDEGDPSSNFKESNALRALESDNPASALVQRIQSRIASLSASCSQEEMHVLLKTLLRYITNALAHLVEPNSKYHSINLHNEVFTRRVGRYEGGVGILQDVGFSREDSGSMVLKRKDAAILWLGKETVESALSVGTEQMAAAQAS
eukprot:Rmarinus@m.29579